GVAGAITATRGAAWGLAAAFVLVALQYIGKEWRNAYVQEEPVFPLDSPEVIAKIVEEHLKEK
ncbi:MAG TPA: hypothetical protein PKZ93_13170, partial [Spirochaetota bacterium]|nr:hypothetical protein [Spirochaetota bacterium]